MRPRNKKHLEERFEKCIDLTIQNPVEAKGKWKTLYKNPDSLLHLEIGCGKGAFITGMAEKNPSVSFIAMECVKNVIVTAMEKTVSLGYENIIFLNQNAEHICEYFEKGEIDKIYLNFSDPWPKKGHAKRRLTHISKLNIYKTLMKDGAELRLKTDNDALFEFSLEQFEEAGFELCMKTTDLHSSEYNKDNVMTEYERNFSEKGKNINAAVVIYHKDK